MFYRLSIGRGSLFLAMIPNNEHLATALQTYEVIYASICEQSRRNNYRYVCGQSMLLPLHRIMLRRNYLHHVV